MVERRIAIPTGPIGESTLSSFVISPALWTAEFFQYPYPGQLSSVNNWPGFFILLLAQMPSTVYRNHRLHTDESLELFDAFYIWGLR